MIIQPQGCPSMSGLQLPSRYTAIQCRVFTEAHSLIRTHNPEILILNASGNEPRLPRMCRLFLDKQPAGRILAVHEGTPSPDWKLNSAIELKSAYETGLMTDSRDNPEEIIAHLDRMTAREDAKVTPMVLHGVSPAIRKLKTMITRFADFEYPVLIRGESGTGKEIVASCLHHSSRQASGNLVSLDCGTVPESLAESMLFGSERGAYTDATDRPGAVEEAGGGTLFLDEIGNLSQPGQCRLLRVLETREFRRLGGKRTMKAEFRLVSATSINFSESLVAGTFRSDLYYRINTLVLDIPPLRERPEDIEPIAVDMCMKYSRGRNIPGISAIDRLQSHSWPGNVRELRNTIQRAIVLRNGGGELDAEDIVFV